MTDEERGVLLYEIYGRLYEANAMLGDYMTQERRIHSKASATYVRRIAEKLMEAAKRIEELDR